MPKLMSKFLKWVAKFAIRRCTSYTDSQESVYLIAKTKKKKFIKFTNKLYCWNFVKISSFVLLYVITIINFPVLPSGKLTMFLKRIQYWFVHTIIISQSSRQYEKRFLKIPNLDFNKKNKKRIKNLKKSSSTQNLKINII